MTGTPMLYTSAARVPRGARKLDALESALSELFFIEHPHIPKNHPRARALLAAYLKKQKASGVWAYFPWRHTAVRIPDEKTYFRLRTARNRDLISESEQRAYRQMTVGIAGLSVGSAAAAALVATGGPKRIKLADPDIVEITNLNRMRATLLDVGENKATVAARSAWELDPFAHIEVWSEGLSEKGLARFVQKPKLDIFIDEMDDIALKFASREACRAARIPVLMATDNGDGLILDVERFDQEPKRPIFHGRVRAPQGKISSLTRAEFVALSSKIIDPAYFTERQQDSILAIGKRLSGIAQLGTAATMAGAAVAYAARRIAIGAPLPSGRYVMSSEAAFIPGYTSATARAKRARHTKAFVRKLLG